MYILLALLQPFDGLFSNSLNFTKNRNGERIYITELGDTGAKRSSLVVTYLLFWLRVNFLYVKHLPCDVFCLLLVGVVDVFLLQLSELICLKSRTKKNKIAL